MLPPTLWYRLSDNFIKTKSGPHRGRFSNNSFQTKNKEGRKHIISINNQEQAQTLLNDLVRNDIVIEKFELLKPTLHEIFIEKVGE